MTLRERLIALADECGPRMRATPSAAASTNRDLVIAAARMALEDDYVSIPLPDGLGKRLEFNYRMTDRGIEWKPESP